MRPRPMTPDILEVLDTAGCTISSLRLLFSDKSVCRGKVPEQLVYARPVMSRKLSDAILLPVLQHGKDSVCLREVLKTRRAYEGFGQQVLVKSKLDVAPLPIDYPHVSGGLAAPSCHHNSHESL